MLIIGIGTSAAAFTVVDSVLLRPLPYPQAERIVYLYGSELEKENLAEVEGSLVSFTEVAVHGLVDVNVGYGDKVTRAVAMPVSESFFRILGSTPAHGRLFAASDFAAVAPPVVIITDGLAVRQFGYADNAVGETLAVDGRYFTVIGVMPPGFRYQRHASAEMWLPAEHTGDRARSVIARLADGVTVDEARSEAVRIARRIDGSRRTPEQDANVSVQSLPESVVAFSRGRIQLVVAVAALVFVVACANVANLFLARNARRAQELSIRLALGAHRWRLIGQLLLEGALLAALAAFSASVLGLWVTRALIAIQPVPLPGAEVVSLNWRVLGFAALLSGLTVILFGALTAAAFPRGALVLRGNRGDAPPRWLRLRDGLVIGQVLASTVLFIVGALFLRSYEQLVPADSGFEWRDRLALRVELPVAGYESPGAREAFFDRLRSDLAQLPGVLSVSGATDLPLTHSHFSVAVPNPLGSTSDATMVLLRAATPNYLQSMGFRILRGRGIEEADRSDRAPVAVINESMADYLWPSADPLGRHFEMPTSTRGNVTLEVVGVIADAWLSARRGGSRPEVFVPYAQEQANALGIVIHAPNPERLSDAAVQVVRRLEPRVPVVGPNREFGGPATLESVVSDALSAWRYQAWLVAIFATLV